MTTIGLGRRDVLKLSVLGAAATALPLRSTLAARDASDLDASKLPKPYAAAFTVPPVLTPVSRDDTPGDTYGTVPSTGEVITGSRYVGTDFYRLVARPTTAKLLPSGVATTMWGYNGVVPGPTIRTYCTEAAPRRVVVQHVNQLPARHPTLGYTPWTSTHLHGSPSKPQYDGYASDVTQPGQWKNYQYPNNVSPRTLWYHDHGVHHTAENVYMGLAAQYHVVDEALERALGIPRWDRTLPAGAPQFEAPLILGDVMFAGNGQLKYDDEGHSGLYGDVVLVNGVPWPTMAVEPRKYRFRLLNGAIARGFDLSFSNSMPFQVVATDGGFMAEPQTVTRMRVGMGERYELVVDFAGLRGQTVRLLNAGVDNARDYEHTGKVMQFRVGQTVTSTAGNGWMPAGAVPPHPAMLLDPRQSTATRRLRVERSNGQWVINGDTWTDVVDSGYERTFARVAPDAVETWEVENSSGGWFHPVHVHLVDFQVLSRNGAAPFPWERGPKDVVYVGEGETVRLLMRFSHGEGRYMIHCHNNAHEDHDMMVQYQVGEHSADCDSIATDPPRPGPWPQLPGEDGVPTAAPTTTTPTTTAAPTTTAPTTTTPPRTTAPTTTKPRGRR